MTHLLYLLVYIGPIMATFRVVLYEAFEYKIKVHISHVAGCVQAVQHFDCQQGN